MLISGKSFMCTKISHHFFREKGKRFITTLAKKQDFLENSETKKKPIFEFKVSSKILAQSAIAVSGLGFVDAGYSGDWSRIGVISKEIEDVLKITAFVVVPLCLFLIFSVSSKSKN